MLRGIGSSRTGLPTPAENEIPQVKRRDNMSRKAIFHYESEVQYVNFKTGLCHECRTSTGTVVFQAYNF